MFLAQQPWLLALATTHHSAGFVYVQWDGCPPECMQGHNYLASIPPRPLLGFMVMALPKAAAISHCPQGDSGFLILRNNTIVLESHPQQRGWNCPLQLHENGHGNNMSEADADNIALEDGDLIIMGEGERQG